MNDGKSIGRRVKKRWVIFGLIGGLLALLVVLGAQLPRDLRALSTADSDNARWTVLQVDTEFANLSGVLAEGMLAEVPNSELVRLRTDIALSRADLLLSGRSRTLLGSSSEVTTLIEDVSTYRTGAIEIIDKQGPLSSNDISALKTLTSEVRTSVRQLVLRGLSLESALADQQRSELAAKLRRFGLVAIALVTWLAIALLYVDRLLRVTHKKDAELQASTERLSATVAASLDGIVIANTDGKIIDFNDAATSIFGWEREEILGRKMDDTIVPHQHRDAHAKGMARYLSTHEPHVVDAGRIELSALRKTGEEFPIELNITSANGAEGEIFIAYVRDISERKISEKKLIDARETAERTDRAKSNFLAVMSHEMRTPLNGILGVLDLLKTTDLDSRQSRYVQVAAASGEILLEHVNEALDIARIEAGVMSLTPEVFSLRATVFRIADVLRTLAAEKELALKVDFDPAMDREFYADGVRVNQILTNIIGNAIKFTEVGSIVVRVSGIHSPERTNVTISVTDTGPGIREEQLEDIFGDFVALAQPTGRQRRGDGLGLSISRKVARIMQGDLTVKSVVGEGSTFKLDIPLERADSVAKPRVVSRIKTPAEKRDILVVEDNAINRSVLKEMLLGFGHNVTEAENGLEALKQAAKSRFDVIIMDISMPFMDGVEATRRIREGNGPNSSTFVLGLSAHGRQEFRQKSEAAGMDRFCTKPVRLAELQSILEGAANPVVADTEHNRLSVEILDDLYSALGQDKLSITVQQFFGELHSSLSDLKRRTPSSEVPAILEMLHKLRGASGMMGLGSLATSIDKASEAVRDGQTEAFRDALDDLERDGEDASARVSVWLAAQKE